MPCMPSSRQAPAVPPVGPPIIKKMVSTPSRLKHCAMICSPRKVAMLESSAMRPANLRGGDAARRAICRRCCQVSASGAKTSFDAREVEHLGGRFELGLLAAGVDVTNVDVAGGVTAARLQNPHIGRAALKLLNAVLDSGLLVFSRATHDEDGVFVEIDFACAGRTQDVGSQLVHVGSRNFFLALLNAPLSQQRIVRTSGGHQ